MLRCCSVCSHCSLIIIVLFSGRKYVKRALKRWGSFVLESRTTRLTFYSLHLPRDYWALSYGTHYWADTVIPWSTILLKGMYWALSPQLMTSSPPHSTTYLDPCHDLKMYPSSSSCFTRLLSTSLERLSPEGLCFIQPLTGLYLYFWPVTVTLEDHVI